MKSKQIIFLKAMLEEPTITSACKQAGITRKTAYAYMNDEEFKNELNKRRNECIDDTVRYFQSKLALCNKTLINIIENKKTSDQVKINAVNSVYMNCKAMTDSYQILNRIAELENRLKGQEK